MEVGAVKQAFNNEVILLKKKLNQAKIQIIHKLTRKAKTLTEKRAPHHIKEKLKKKAESAINEVLIIKKIKARDIAKFMITHTGQVKDYLNRPKADSDKACARLVLHKSLQDKYTFIRNRFGNIPIKDLFMSRQERRKLKKEAKEQQKNKKKGKTSDGTSSAGDWDVEDLRIGKEADDSKKDSDDEYSNDESDQIQDNKFAKLSDVNDSVKSGSENGDKGSGKNDEELLSSDEESLKGEESDEDPENDDNNVKLQDESEEEEVGKLIKIKNDNTECVRKPKLHKRGIHPDLSDIVTDIANNKKINAKYSKSDKKLKDTKNKNLKEKLQNRKFKKAEDDAHVEGRKVVDPFFITATGENYLSLAEPRQPDEVKEVHKQGNRQERRAAMFGRKFKPKNDFRGTNFKNKFNERNDNTYSDVNRKNDRINNSNDINYRNSNFNEKNHKFNDRNSNFNNKSDKFNSKKVNNNDDKKEEKLHPSWEAKRKLKSMSLLPSQGKKIVFNDN